MEHALEPLTEHVLRQADKHGVLYRDVPQQPRQLMDVHKMKNKYIILAIAFLLFTIMFKYTNALTQNERDDLTNKINELKDNKEYFENLLRFLEEKFNLKNEPEIVNMLKVNAENLGIDISKYPNTFSKIQQEKQEEIPRTEIKQDNNLLKLILILVILALIFYIMRRFIKNKNIIKKKRQK